MRRSSGVSRPSERPEPSRGIRVGIVDYLNSRPLAWDFLRGRAPSLFRPTYQPPAQVADALQDGRLDIGLVPSIEVQRIRGLRVVGGPCVAAQEEVRSVILVAKVGPEKILRVALDENSRTSAALLRILLAERYGRRPEFISSSPHLEHMLEDADAALIIGDPALQVPRGKYRVLDLAGEWHWLTGLPFVFAVWAMRDGCPELSTEEIRSVFLSSRESGTAALETIAAEAAQELGLAKSELERYLRENLSYDLGERERRSLGEFFRMAKLHGLIDAVRPLEFLE